MRKVEYGVAVSLDGYLAGPDGEADWINMDPEIDFSAIWARFDTLLMGRRTYEAAIGRLGRAAFTGKAVYEVDSVSVTIIPVLLGSGTPLMPSPYNPTKLTLTAQRVYRSGIISATYEIDR